MDHVINALKTWLEIYEDNKPEDQDRKAISCIKNALDELHKYYDR